MRLKFLVSSERRTLFFLTAIIPLTMAFQNCSKVEFQEELPSVAPLCRDLDAAEVTPRLKWDWYQELQAFSGEKYNSFNQTMAAPMVADLDGDRRPEVVFINFSTTAEDWFADRAGLRYSANGVLRIVDGATGRTKVSIADQNLAPFGSHSPLLMDIDGDGMTEIFYLHYTRNKLIALNANGSARWEFELTSIVTTKAGFSGADLDGDGRGEILTGMQVISEDDSRKPFAKVTFPTEDPIGTVLAMPLEPSRPDKWSIVTSAALYDAKGGLIAPLPAGVRFLAAADLFPEIPGIEIVATAPAKLFVINGLNGDPIRSVDLTLHSQLSCGAKGVGGGPPSIGDFDGDPTELEIAVATGRHLTIFNRDGHPKYATVTQDCSSLITGLTSFDLNGDKKPEVLYADEEYLRIFEVKDGELRVVHKIVNPSGTLAEYPVVADLTGTGASNILLVSNNYNANNLYKDGDEANDLPEALKTTGVRAYESSAEHAWMPTRPIWNQYNFHPDLTTDQARFVAEPRLDTTIFRRNNQSYNTMGQCR